MSKKLNYQTLTLKFLTAFIFWILHPVACIIMIVGNTVHATIYVVVRFLFLTAATCFGLYLTIFRRICHIQNIEYRTTDPLLM
jgi:hypothetical protein